MHIVTHIHVAITFFNKTKNTVMRVHMVPFPCCGFESKIYNNIKVRFPLRHTMSKIGHNAQKSTTLNKAQMQVSLGWVASSGIFFPQTHYRTKNLRFFRYTRYLNYTQGFCNIEVCSSCFIVWHSKLQVVAKETLLPLECLCSLLSTLELELLSFCKVVTCV